MYYNIATISVLSMLTMVKLNSNFMLKLSKLSLHFTSKKHIHLFIIPLILKLNISYEIVHYIPQQVGFRNCLWSWLLYPWGPPCWSVVFPEIGATILVSVLLFAHKSTAIE